MNHKEYIREIAREKGFVIDDIEVEKDSFGIRYSVTASVYDEEVRGEIYEDPKGHSFEEAADSVLGRMRDMLEFQRDYEEGKRNPSSAEEIFEDLEI